VLGWLGWNVRPWRVQPNQCQQARQSMQKRSANGHHAKEDCAGGLRDVSVGEHLFGFRRIGG